MQLFRSVENQTTWFARRDIYGWQIYPRRSTKTKSRNISAGKEALYVFFCSPRLVALDIPTFAGSTTTHTLDYPYLEYHKAEMCRPQSLDIIRWRIWINTQIMLGLFGDMVDLHSGVLLVASYFLNFFFSSKYPRVSIVYQDACSLPIQYSWTVTYIIKMQKKTITLTLHRLNATFDAEIML